MAKIKTLALNALTIRREGQVDWRVSGPHHCGPVSQLVGGRIPVRYTVVIRCAPSLDERGFLIDQVGVDLWIRSFSDVNTTLSCEMLAQDVGERMLAKIAKDRPTCKVLGLKVVLSPAPFQASIEAEFGTF